MTGGVTAGKGAFSPGAVAGLLAVGACAFLLLLYALGNGWTGDGDGGGGEHAASGGLNGFAGLASLLEHTGHRVELSRNPASFEGDALVVLTPPPYADPDEINAVLEQRRYTGPTMLVLPKWQAVPVPEAEAQKAGAEDDWIKLDGAAPPAWFSQLDIGQSSEVAIGQTHGWEGYAAHGALAKPGVTQALVTQPMFPLDPLVVDSERDMLAGIAYPGGDDDAWPVVVVFEPDLLNNFGMADAARAALALKLVDELGGYSDTNAPILFDLTFAGLGKSQNLLTLAFAPPFLAATLCLMLAALVIAWRSFRRFGPPVAELPALALGKTQLAYNGAGLLGRLRRWHLLAGPYAELIAARIAAQLGIRQADHAARDAAIERALVRAGHETSGYGGAIHAMRQARSGAEILRSARALKSIERMLKR